MNTQQLQQWDGEFGRQYTDRNAVNLDDLDRLYLNLFGMSRSALNTAFLADLPRNLRILEVGCNIGNQLALLQAMGFTELNGIEIQAYALAQARSNVSSANLVEGSALNLPFADQEFDLVFTSGVLIHIHPDDLAKVMAEIHRCTKQYIWGFEYYADTLTEVPYREHQNLMWKGPYAALYIQQFKDLHVIKKQKVDYLQNTNRDEMFLLSK